MIRNFADTETQLLWEKGKSKRLPAAIIRVALRKLVMLHSAEGLQDLRIPAGNRLEQLKGNRKGQHSIRINRRYRICFRWEGGGAHDVEITDYH